MPSDKKFWFCRDTNCPDGLQPDRESGRGDGQLRCRTCGGEIVSQDIAWAFDGTEGGHTDDGEAA
jgi:hypothetical protein